MKISYNWLKDYVDIKVSPDKLAEILTMSGLTVDSIEAAGGDSIMEVEVTSNRPDWLSYIGIAREVAAMTGKKLKIPVVKKLLPTSNSKLPTIKVEDKALCPRYTARVIRNVKVGESPQWLKKKIEAMGLRSVNNIVDITNFCLFETGEPMHAFDLDKLARSTIIVRKSAKGEKITAIDGVSRQLDNSMLVIADSEKPVAIAGVMGGLDTEVGLSTKNILLEAAYFDPISIRRTSRKLALPSESSYRFERKVNIDNIVYASDRATQLILELAGGQAQEFIDAGKTKSDITEVSLRFKKMNDVIGVQIPASRAKTILTALGLKIKSSSKDMLKIEIPKFRSDLKDEIDLIEEAARVYGYGNILETIPAVAESGERLPIEMVVARKIHRALKGMGLSEIITYSLLSRKLINMTKIPDDGIVEIKNPLSGEQEIMRPTLVTGMLNSMRWNINRKTSDLVLFELGKIYSKEGSSQFSEKTCLSIGLTGFIYDGWLRAPRDLGLFDVKGIVESLFSQLGIKDYTMKEGSLGYFLQGTCAAIETKNETLGFIGEIDPAVSNNFDIKNKIYAAHIDCEKILKHLSLEKHFQDMPKYPPVVRDISIVADKNILNEKISSSIRQAAGLLLKEIQLIDRYSGGQIPDGKMGLTYRLKYQDPGKTLEDKDISQIHSQIVRALEDNFQAKLR